MPEDDLIGRRVLIYTAYGDSETGVVVAEIGNGMIKVKSDEDGEILVGNQYEDL
jgi:hypothetical protein